MEVHFEKFSGFVCGGPAMSTTAAMPAAAVTTAARMAAEEQQHSWTPLGGGQRFGLGSSH